MKGTFTYLTCLMLLGISLVLQTGLLSFLIPSPTTVLPEYSLLLPTLLLVWAVSVWKQPLRHLMHSLKQIYPLDADSNESHQKRLNKIPFYSGLPLLRYSFHKKTQLWCATCLLLLAVMVQRVEAQTYTMGTAPATNNATITTCGGTFYDPGGAAGNYANNQNLTVTFTSTNGLPIMMDFITYTFAAGDNLSIYNGPSTASPQFPTSPLGSGDPFLYVGTSGSITVQFISNASVVAAGWEAVLYCSTESTITACDGNFYDPGGVGANYSAQQGTITHICSNNGGQARVAFSSFATEAGFDYLYIYDGPTISSPQIAGSPFSGATSPGTVTGTGTCLTFFFVADQITNAAGWASTISCVPNCAVSAVTAIPACSGSLYNVTGNVTFSSPPTTGTMTVSDGAASQVFNAPFTSPSAYSLTGLTSGTGTHTVTAIFSATPSCTGSIMYAAPVTCTCPTPNCGTVTLVKNP
jgi:CUB domain